MANFKKIIIAILLLGLILILLGYSRNQTPIRNQNPIITEFSVSPENPVVGQTATIKVSAEDDNGIKGFELSIAGKKIQVNCNNQKICTKQITREIPETAIRTVILKLTVADSTGKKATQQKEVVIIHETINPVCGNDLCESGETTESCSVDCKEPEPICGNNICEAGEISANCPDDCKEEETTELITKDFFGVQTVGHLQEHYDLMDKSFSSMKDMGANFIFVEGAVWNEIEPNPPVDEIHNYDWSKEDLKFEVSKKYGLKVQTALLSRSDWATTHKENEVDEWCCDMFPLNEGYEDDWQAFVKAYVERYYDYGLREITLGNEINAPAHFIEYGGTAENYDVILSNAYKGAKEANPNIVVGIGFASSGSFFDDNPSENEIRQRKSQSSLVNAVFSFLEDSIKISKDSYDVYTTQCNYHYSGITPFYDWIKKEMQKQGYDKPIFCEHTRSTLYNVKKGNVMDSKLPPYYADKNKDEVEDIIEILQSPDHPEFKENRKLYFADQARQTVRKLAVALAGGRERAFIAMSADPYSCQASIYSWDANWRLTGLLDTRHYCETGNIQKARKPAYYSYKQFIDKVVGANRKVETLNLGDNIYAYKFIKNNKLFFIIWHENMFDTDEEGLVKRNQQKTVDLSPYVSSNKIKITHIVTELDSSNNPIYPADQIVLSDSISISETPIFVEEN